MCVCVYFEYLGTQVLSSKIPLLVFAHFLEEQQDASRLLVWFLSLRILRDVLRAHLPGQYVLFAQHISILESSTFARLLILQRIGKTLGRSGQVDGQ